MNEISNYIAELERPILITKYDQSNYVVNLLWCERFYVMNSFMKLLIEEIDDKKSIFEITKKLNNQIDVSLEEKDVYLLITEKLASLGILKGSEKFEKESPNYLRLKNELLSSHTSSWIASPFKSFIKPNSFYFILFFAVLINVLATIWIYTNYSFEELFFSLNLWSIIVFTVGVPLFHEIGHIAASNKFGVKTGSIGFGFYLFSPVFFSDVTNIWSLSKNQRVIVNLSGIYMQAIIGVILLAVFYLSAQDLLLPLIILNFGSILVNINPMLRYDGYWVLSDLSNTYNLRKKSTEIAQETMKKILTIEKPAFKLNKNLFLGIYGILSSLFIVFFLITILFHNPNSILKFPIDITYFITNKLYNISEFDLGETIDGLKNLFVPFLFYFFLIKFIKKRYYNVTNKKQ